MFPIVLPTLITSEHADKPNYMAMVVASCQPSEDLFALYQSLNGLYDIDVATGAQLDTIGRIIGIGRTIQTGFYDVYFSFDVAGLGLDEAPWFTATDPTNSSVTLADSGYRILLKARILANHWDGSVPGAYDLANLIYTAYGYKLAIVEEPELCMMIGLVCDFNANLSQVIDDGLNVVTGYSPSLTAQDNVFAASGVAGSPPPELIALLANGYLDIKPGTVRTEAYFWPASPGRMFAFDVENTWLGGFDDGLIPGAVFTAAPAPTMQFGFDSMTLTCSGFDVGYF